MTGNEVDVDDDDNDDDGFLAASALLSADDPGAAERKQKRNDYWSGDDGDGRGRRDDFDGRPRQQQQKRNDYWSCDDGDGRGRRDDFDGRPRQQQQKRRPLLPPSLLPPSRDWYDRDFRDDHRWRERDERMVVDASRTWELTSANNERATRLQFPH